MSHSEREVIAHHEAGHAIVASVLPGTDPVHKISIVQRGFGALGYTLQLPLEERYLMTREELRSRLAVLLGGRTAEEVALGEISTGAQNDLRRATDLARSMVAEFGMGETLGVMSVETRRRGRFLEADGRPGVEAGEVAEHTAERIDIEVKQLLDEAHERARGVLTERHNLLETVAERLLEHEVLEGDELRELLARPQNAGSPVENRGQDPPPSDTGPRDNSPLPRVAP